MQEGYLGIREIQVMADWFDQQVQDLPVNEREDIGERQNAYDIPGIDLVGIVCSSGSRRMGVLHFVAGIPGDYFKYSEFSLL